MEQANSIDAYLSLLERYQDGDEQYYRGQLEKYKSILPTVARDPGYAKNEANIYAEAISLGADELKDLTSPLEKLSKLQHYGVPTRLIDVTIDPLIALYFAVENESDPSPGNVYLYQVKGYSADSKKVRILSLLPTINNPTVNNLINEYEKQFNDSISAEEILSCVGSPIILQHSKALQKSNPRLYRQKGTFLLCGNKVQNNIITKELQSLDTYTPTLVIRIPFEYKEAIKKELDYKYKINVTTIYPELPSIAQYIRERYKEENISLNGAYSIINAEDVSIGVAKRVSIIIVLNEQLTINQIKLIAIDIMQRYQKSQNVIWLYVARNGDDYITYNWLLRAQWIDPKLNPQFQPIKLPIQENGYYWDYNQSYSIWSDIFAESTFDDDSSLYTNHQQVWENFLLIYTKLIDLSRNASWHVFVRELLNKKKKITTIYNQLQDFKHSHDKEFDDFLGSISVAVGLVDDLHFLIENEKINNEGTKYMIIKRLNEASIRIEQINQGFVKWKIKLNA